MNTIDIIILAVLAASVIYGLFRGFLGSLLSAVCFLLSLALAAWAGPLLSDALTGNSGVMDTVASYTDSVVVGTSADFYGGSAPEIIEKIASGLPVPESVRQALADRLSAQTDKSGSALRETANREVARIVIGALSYVICFVLACILLSVVSSLIRHVFKLPVLKQMDALAGGLLGLLRGALILYVLFLLVPVISSLSPVNGFDELIAESKLAGIFQSNGYFIRVIGRIF